MSVALRQTLKINAENLTEIFEKLKQIYNCSQVSQERKDYLAGEIAKYGYLPYPHIKALEELSEGEAIFALEEKLKFNKTYQDNKFVFEEDKLSAVKRAGYNESSWVNKEGHNLKLVNLAGLGNGNNSEETGRFIDWVKQLITLPAGNIERGILATTMYLIPFHPREFGCAYLPKSSEVSEGIEDKLLKENLQLNVKNQVRLYLALTQLAGHPTMYDVLPQTGRFSKTVLAKPYVARWFDIKELISKLKEESGKIALKLSQTHNCVFVERVKNIIEEELSGVYIPVTDDIKELYEDFSEKILKFKKQYSNNMLSKEKQEEISARAKAIIAKMIDREVQDDFIEEDFYNHGEVIGKLIENGLWPAPGGAWCSSGVPVFDKMSEGGGYPTFKHYDNTGKDVTHFANLDCQTPYYFVYFDKNEYNQKVIDFYVEFLKKLRADYNFDGFRVDHIDHIVDEVSEKDDFPISYRAPRKVLGLANSELKKEVPHFAALAEYMLWDNFFKEYHQDMDFDLLWGSDIISQYLKTVPEIIKNNEQLEEYNMTVPKGMNWLSILKIYNNQDGEFREINQYPGQLGEAGALFKWFKFKFLPGGSMANRPVMFIDGDESFTKTGIEAVIGAEQSMKREKNYGFFNKFAAVNKFGLNCGILQNGKAKIVDIEEKTGFVSWMICSEEKQSAIFVVANQLPPTELSRNEEGEPVQVENKAVHGVKASVPSGYSSISEFVFSENIPDYSEVTEVGNFSGGSLKFEKLEPSEFHVYRLKK